jgi:hypothetical protein
MIQISVLAALAALLLCAGSARADHGGLTIETLRHFCKAAPNSELSNICLAEIVSVGELMEVNSTEISKLPPSEVVGAGWLRSTALCVAPGASEPTTPAMVQAFLNWTDKHTALWDEPPIVGLVKSLAETWHCTPKSPHHPKP